MSNTKETEAQELERLRQERRNFIFGEFVALLCGIVMVWGTICVVSPGPDVPRRFDTIGFGLMRAFMIWAVWKSAKHRAVQ
jgi:hypothetical protein